MSYSLNICQNKKMVYHSNNVEFKKVTPADICKTDEQNVEYSTFFIPGGHKSDSPRDRLFYELYQTGRVDHFAKCLSSETWGKPEGIEKVAFDEILNFLNHKINISCFSKTCNETYTTTFTLISLLRQLDAFIPSEILLIGSYLQEITGNDGFLLKNLKKILDNQLLLKFIENKILQKSGDSDLRVYPKGDITNEDILNLTQEVINFIAECIHNDPANKKFLNNPDFNLYGLRQCVRFTSLSKFCFFDSSKHFPSKDKSTIYSTISFDDKTGKPIDLMFIKEIENPCLFNFDDLKLNIDEFLKPKRQPSKNLALKSSTSENVWQHIIDQSLDILHIPNLDACDEMGWIRLLRHKSKGGRFFEEGVDLCLFKKINLARLPDLINKYFKKLESSDNTSLIALYIHILIFLKKNRIDQNIIDEIKKPAMLQKTQENLFEYIFAALNEPELTFELIYSFIHSLLFLNLFQSNSNVVISRCGIEAVFEISKTYFLETCGSIPRSIDFISSTLLKQNHLSENALRALENLKSCLIPTGSYILEINEHLSSRLKYFDLDLKNLPLIAKKLLEHPNYMLQQYGYNLLVISFSRKNDIEILHTLLKLFPKIIVQEIEDKIRLQISQSLADLLDKTIFSNFKSALFSFNKIEYGNLKEYLNQLILEVDLSSYSFVFDFWSTAILEPEEKKDIGLDLFEKIVKFDLKRALTFFQNLNERCALTQNEKNLIFKKLCISHEKTVNVEHLILLKNAVPLLINTKNETINPLRAIENELILLVETCVNYNLESEAEEILLLSITHSLVSLEKASSLGIINKLLKPSFLFKENLTLLNQEILENNFQNALRLLKELLKIEKTETESSSLRKSIHDLFLNFSKVNNFSDCYSSLVSDSFQQLYVSDFNEKCTLNCLYLQFATKKKLETPHILSSLLSSFQISADFNCSAGELETFTLSLLDYTTNIQNSLHPSFKALLSEKLSSLIFHLFQHNQNKLSIRLITAMNHQKIQMEFDDEIIGFILNISRQELESGENVKSIHNMFLANKFYQFKTTVNGELTYQIYFLLMEKLKNSNLEHDAKKLLESLILYEEPTLETLFKAVNIFSPKVKDLDFYILLVNGLLSHLEEVRENHELFDKLTDFLKSDTRLYKDDIILNSYFDFKMTLLTIHKLISSKNLDDVSHAFNIFNYDINHGLSKLINVHSCHEDIEKLFLAMVENINKLDLKNKINLSKYFESIIHKIFTHCPDIFSLINISKLTDVMLKSDDPLMYSVCGQILFFLISPLKEKAQEPLISSCNKLLNKLITHPDYYCFQNQQNSLEIIFWAFTDLKTFDLHFKPIFKAEIIRKNLCTHLLVLKKSLNFEVIQKSIFLLTEKLPILTTYPEHEYACVDQAFDLLIPLIEHDCDFFLLNFYKILAHSKEDLFSLSNELFYIYESKNPENIFNYFASVAKKLLDTHFKDAATQNFTLECLYDFCTHLLSNLTMSEIQLKKEPLNKKLAEICKTKRIQFLDIMEKLMFFPAAQHRMHFPMHIRKFEILCKSAVQLNIFDERKKLKNLFRFYVGLDPVYLTLPPSQVPNQHLMDETLKMIKRFLSFDSDIMLVRAIGIYSHAQKIFQQYNFNGKLRSFVEPQKLLDCFNEIQKALIKNPYFEASVVKEADNRLDPDKIHYENEYIYFHFQTTLLDNPNLHNIHASQQWKVYNSEVCASWSQTLIDFHVKENSEDMKRTLLNSLYIFMISCNRLKCFTHNFISYLSILKKFNTHFIKQIEILKANPEKLEAYLNTHSLMTLFDIHTNLKNNEVKIFSNIATATLTALIKMKDPTLKNYIFKQLGIGLGLKIFNTNDITKLLDESKNH